MKKPKKAEPPQNKKGLWAQLYQGVEQGATFAILVDPRPIALSAKNIEPFINMLFDIPAKRKK